MIKKLLLIDDDPDELEILLDVVGKLTVSCTCTWAASAEEGIRLLEDSKPDLVLLDINMPRQNGWECLTILKKKNMIEKIPVVLYSNGVDAGLIFKAKSLGAADAVAKSFESKELIDLLSRIFGIPGIGRN